MDADILAVDRFREATMRDRVRELEGRIDCLTDELRAQYADAFEVRTALSLPNCSMDLLAADVRALFAGICTRASEIRSAVTVVIPGYQKVEFTLRCLRSIATNWSYALNPTLVVVDDASPDDSLRYLCRIPGVHLLCNGTNLGFLRSSNFGAALATTRYVCFLNNDTEVRAGWLDWLVRTADADERIGAVGSKLVYPDGTLQEAGSIIWSDATGWNYGRGGDPSAAEFNEQRDPDYVSGASLLIRTELLREIGGFDERYAPAYYEDADLCFEVRARGYRVVYEPRSELVHHEGISSGTDLRSGVKRYQDINRFKFLDKWATVLPSHLAPSADNVSLAVRRKRGKTILVIDSYVPFHDREAGSNRLFKIVQIFRDIGLHVVFLPDNFATPEPYTSDLLALGVELLASRAGGLERDAALRLALLNIDAAWICRPELCSHYIPIIRAESRAPIVYDTIDLHFARESRRAKIEGGDESVWKKLQEMELAMARAADLVVTVTEIEQRELATFGIDEVAVIPTIHDVEEHEGFGFDVRSGVVFIGGYGHTPNVDAALWLCREIMPIVWLTHPDMRVTLLGNQPPPSVRDLQSERVSVTGFVADVSSFFEEARVFVAPLRYGAGMKGKVGHALSYALPVVTTSIGADGYQLISEENCLIADDSLAFAGAIVRMYDDAVLWERCSAQGGSLIRELGRAAVGVRLRDVLARLGIAVAAPEAISST